MQYNYKYKYTRLSTGTSTNYHIHHPQIHSHPKISNPLISQRKERKKKEKRKKLSQIPNPLIRHTSVTLSCTHLSVFIIYPPLFGKCISIHLLPTLYFPHSSYLLCDLFHPSALFTNQRQTLSSLDPLTLSPLHPSTHAYHIQSSFRQHRKSKSLLGIRVSFIKSWFFDFMIT